ncbi:MAG: hypothetical protein NTV52_00800 [Acidobacteria bacterium]|nr:hypothetical protein [Acidobacteriota bacterium]
MAERSEFTQGQTVTFYPNFFPKLAHPLDSSATDFGRRVNISLNLAPFPPYGNSLHDQFDY